MRSNLLNLTESVWDYWIGLELWTLCLNFLSSLVVPVEISGESLGLPCCCKRLLLVGYIPHVWKEDEGKEV